nr:unnamed protein product [Callosobruchus chinensis]
MGLTNSKIGKQIDNEVPQEGSLPSVPILTPIAIRKNEFDPRSPSYNIARTPLEILTAATDKLEKLYEENATPVKNSAYVLADDPRSPTTEFKRTPIVINDKEDLLKKVHNKNLEKRLQGNIDTTNGAVKPNIVPPKLLESSPIKARPDANKRKSFVGLLETNIDYTETDIDVVFQEKCKVALETPKKIAIVETEDIDPRSPTTQFLRTPIQIVRKIGEIKLNGELSFDEDCEEQTQYEDCIKDILTGIVDKVLYEHDLAPDEVDLNVEQELSTKVDVIGLADSPKILAKEAVQPKLIETEYEDPTFETNIGIVLEREHIHSAPVTPPRIKSIEAKALLDKQIKSAPMSPQVNKQVDVKELDKKLTDLIYEDTDLVVCPRVVTLKDYSVRSPLQNWNGEIGNKKSAPKLKVSDKPRKSDQGVISKIPVFKEKVKRNVQCENTPPRIVEKKKTKPKPQSCLWDPDTTLYL